MRWRKEQRSVTAAGPQLELWEKSMSKRRQLLITAAGFLGRRPDTQISVNRNKHVSLQILSALNHSSLTPQAVTNVSSLPVEVLDRAAHRQTCVWHREPSRRNDGSNRHVQTGGDIITQRERQRECEVSFPLLSDLLLLNLFLFVSWNHPDSDSAQIQTQTSARCRFTVKLC